MMTGNSYCQILKAGWRPKVNNMLNNKVKELALKLHSFPVKDRSWVLANLSAGERTKMEGLLSELDLINKSGSYDFSSELLNNNSEINNPGNDDNILGEISQFIKILDKKSAESVFEVINNEEPWIIALVLEMHDWKWKEQFKKLLNLNKKSQVKHFQSGDINSVREMVKHTILSVVVDSLSERTAGNIDGEKQIFELVFDTPKSNLINTKPIKNKTWWSSIWR